MIPSHVRHVLERSDGVAEMARSHASIDHCAVLGRGFNGAMAFEWALKLREMTYVLAQPFSGEDFLHGPVALVEPGFPVLAIDISGPTHPGVHSLLSDLVERDARLVLVSDAAETLRLSDSAIGIPGDAPEWTTPIPAIVAAQLFTYHLAVAKGLDPDRPRGLSKVAKTR
jgi:glucosamine--fructose-6-phosphate aminotransferase (isomerizing)